MLGDELGLLYGLAAFDTATLFIQFREGLIVLIRQVRQIVQNSINRTATVGVVEIVPLIRGALGFDVVQLERTEG